MICKRCKDTGITYEGTGHRMGGYPWAEVGATVPCTCPRGDAVQAEKVDWVERAKADNNAADDEIEKARKEHQEHLSANNLKTCRKCDRDMPRDGFTIHGSTCHECEGSSIESVVKFNKRVFDNAKREKDNVHQQRGKRAVQGNV